MGDLDLKTDQFKSPSFGAQMTPNSFAIKG